ncbi:MAG TPA: sigma-70 family RNA polymerase sigma factor [Opitutaceae bacterium]
MLRRYSESGSEEAFTELVSRHFNLVYFAALRQLPHAPNLAEEVAQRTFCLLARKAPALARHPALAGWLHTTALFAARDLRRAETRRHHREQQAFAMNEMLSDPSPEVEWERIRPVIDSALGELEPRDREAILLRFFENRPYAEIGAVLNLTANTVRMRIERATDRLRTALARRGVTSTAAALGAALTVPGGVAAPAGLAHQTSAAALAGAGTVGIGATLFTTLQLMISAKTIATSATAAALVALGVALHQHQQLASAHAAGAALRQQQAELQGRIQDLETKLASVEARAADSADGQLAAVPSATATDTLAPPAAPVTRDQVEARYRKARELAKSGRHAEALGEYLWCYDTGMRQVEGYFITRYSAVLEAIAALGKDYPPALDALRQRRDAAEARLRLSATDMEAGKDYGQINHVLGEDATTYAYFDSLPEDDPRRQHIFDTSIRRLMESRRYRELDKAMPYVGMPKVWEEMVEVARNIPNEAARQQCRRNVIRFAASQVELRAGAGNEVNANDMIERLLIFDASPETIATINEHLVRSGRADLVIKP